MLYASVLVFTLILFYQQDELAMHANIKEKVMLFPDIGDIGEEEVTSNLFCSKSEGYL
jgi:hypothetical protein